MGPGRWRGSGSGYGPYLPSGGQGRMNPYSSPVIRVMHDGLPDHAPHEDETRERIITRHAH